MLATGFLSYLGPFNQNFRNLLLSRWEKEMSANKIPFSENLNLISLLTDAATIGEWNLHGLPSDELSIQNGIIVTKATRYPLLIDPQTQGKAWIMSREKENELQVNRSTISTSGIILRTLCHSADPFSSKTSEKNWTMLWTMCLRRTLSSRASPTSWRQRMRRDDGF